VLIGGRNVFRPARSSNPPPPRHAVLTVCLTALIVLLTKVPALAHELRPGYLEIRETAAHRYDVLWKQPALGDLRLSIDPVLAPTCATIDRTRQQVPGAYVDRMTVACEGGLSGTTISVAGLEATVTDVLVRLEFADGRRLTEILKPSHPVFTVPASGPSAGAASFLWLGVEHILLGVDHLLFVLGLVLLVGPRWLLLKTITAFTAGHSISLALATLGMVSVPGPPLEAAIALSIVFLAADVIRSRRGERHLTARRPWLIAGGFGLLHGLGFATALTALGLPSSAIPIALVLFNVGVELGQVVFIGCVLALAAAWRSLDRRSRPWLDAWPLYATGIVAAFWFAERLSALLSG
jgi:hydrogenase/urease accessory protein HupE